MSEKINNATASNIFGILSVVFAFFNPVAGLVEIPCVMRNAIGSGNALISADLALAGVESQIPVDEVIGAMDRVGRNLPASLREEVHPNREKAYGRGKTQNGRALMIPK